MGHFAPFSPMKSTDQPTIEEAIAIHAEASKILHESLNREYLRRRENLVKAGMASRISTLLPSLQNDVRDMASMAKFAGEHKRTVQACFTTWTPPRIVAESRIPQNY